MVGLVSQRRRVWFPLSQLQQVWPELGLVWLVLGQQAWRLLSELVLVLPEQQQVWLVPQGLESLQVWLEQPLLGEVSPQVLWLV